MIDLHLHTTASDGRCTPAELVERAAEAGLTTLAVTDHDTTSATAEVRALCAARGVRAVSGIEITAVEAGFDVHVLGYFVDPEEARLRTFLVAQREDRVARVTAIAERLAMQQMPIDITETLARARVEGGRSVGRPHVARAMVDAGHVASVSEAFERWLGAGRPAFVPRSGAPVAGVIAVIHGAGGLASLAHPVQLRDDALIPRFRDDGLDALEVYHSDHREGDRVRYRGFADELGLLMTGGSDYHGETGRRGGIGSSTLPDEAWDALVASRPEAH